MGLLNSTSKKFVPFLDLEAPEKIPLHRLRWFILPLAAFHFSFMKYGVSNSILLLSWAIIAIIYLSITEILWKFLQKSYKLLLLLVILDLALISTVFVVFESVESLFFLVYLIPIFYIVDYLRFRNNMYLVLGIGMLYLTLEVIRIYIFGWTINQVLPSILFRLFLLSTTSLAFVRYRDKRTKLEKICEGIGSGISIIGLDWRIIFMNRIQREWFPNAKLGGICYKEYNGPAQKTRCSWCPVIKARQSGKPERGITHSPDSDNPHRIRHYDVIANPMRNKRGDIIAVIEIVNDITESIELGYLETTVENILEDEQTIELLYDVSKMIEANGCAIMVFDMEGENATVRQIFPSPKGRSDTSNIRIESFPSLQELYSNRKNPIPISIPSLRADEAGAPDCIVNAARRNNLRPGLLVPIMLGEQLWAAVLFEWKSSRTREISDDEIRSYKNAVSAVEMFFNRALVANQLWEVSERKERIISSLRHEMLSPMIKVQALVEEAIELKSKPEELEKKLKRLKEMSQRSERIFFKVITASRLEKGTLALELEDVDVISLISTVKSDLNSLIKKYGVNVNIDNRTGNEKLIVKADKVLFYEVVANILTNAITYSNQDDTVDISIEKPNQKIIIKFVDEGIGIPEDEKEKIFDEGYRTRTAQEERSEGSGLGLFIVKGIVEEHGWDIHVDSEIGKGSCFTIIIPIEGGEDVS